MNLLIIFLLIVILIMGVFLFIAYREEGEREVGGMEEFSGICNISSVRSSQRQENLDKIISLFSEKDEVSNNEIREALGVASRTVVRYMDELENQGKVKQVGKTGHTVVYKLK